MIESPEEKIAGFERQHLGHVVVQETNPTGREKDSGPATWVEKIIKQKCLSCSEEISVTLWVVAHWSQQPII